MTTKTKTDRSAKTAATTASTQTPQPQQTLDSTWNNPRGVVPTLPDRDLMPEVDEVLVAYDTAAKLIEHAHEATRRRKELPNEFKQAQDDHEKAVGAAAVAGKPIPTLGTISDLQAEQAQIDATSRALNNAALRAWRDWGEITLPHMDKLTEPALDDLDDALTALSAAFAAVEREVERVRKSKGVIQWAADFTPRFRMGHTPMLVEGETTLREAIAIETRYAELVRQRRLRA